MPISGATNTAHQDAQPCSTLLALELTNCKIASLQPLQAALQSPSCRLQHLAITSVCPARPILCPVFLGLSASPATRSSSASSSLDTSGSTSQDIRVSTGQRPCLQCLDLSLVQEPRMDTDALLGMIAATPTLQHLALPPVQPEAHDLEAVVRALAEADHLRAFRWDGITLNLASMEVLFEWVAHTQCLHRLVLRHCDLAGPAALKAAVAKLAMAALNNTHLLVLDMHGSDFFASKDLRRRLRPLCAKRGIVFTHGEEGDQ